jgi:hypothetical protein
MSKKKRRYAQKKSYSQEGDNANAPWPMFFCLLGKVRVLDFCCSYCVLTMFLQVLTKFPKFPMCSPTHSQLLLTSSHILCHKFYSWKPTYVAKGVYFETVQSLIFNFLMMDQTKMPIMLIIIIIYEIFWRFLQLINTNHNILAC